MKKFTAKIIYIIISCVMLSGAFCFPAGAISANEYGLGLSVNCEESDGKAVADIALKNSNSFDVEGVALTVTAPDGLNIASGDCQKSIGTLKSNESYNASLSFESAVEQVAVELPAPERVEEKETDYSKVIAAAAAAAVIAAVAAVLIKKNKKAAALMLAAVIMLPFAGMFSVHAIGVDEAESFVLDAYITVDGEEYPLIVKVDYTASSAKNSYFEFETAPEATKKDGQTVNRLTTGFSGTATANGAVKNVTYEVKSEIDGYENAVTGEASLNGCDWSADSLALKPGKNEITFTAELENGETQTQTYELTYDRGELYEYKPEEIKADNGKKYVENVINIYFDVNTSDKRIAEILAEQRLAQIGEINSIYMVQTRTLAADLDELNEKIAQIEKYDEVLLACTEDIIDLETNVVPDDTWNIYNNTGYTETWDENIPGGYNWHVEAIQAPSAWEYNKYFNSVTLGVIDGGFKTDHEDYNDLIHFTNSTYQNGNDPTSLHGTHVAGIIGAEANNGTGITGLLWNVDIYGAAYTTGGSNSVTNVVNEVTAIVEAGAKAVNLSLGLTNPYNAETNPNPYLNPYSDEELARYASPCAVGMSSLISQGREFVVVQSAGNGVVDSRIGIASYRSADAYQNGLYCSVLENGSYGSLSALQVKAVYDRIIVVGAVRNKSNVSNGLRLDMYERGNSGDRVDIYAPGVVVYSTIADHYEDDVLYKYGGMTGTSQAAPVVTAVAGLCFAINPDFSGAQVKAIICDDANSACVARDYSLKTTVADGTVIDYHPFEGDGKVINMKLCAEAALRTVCKKASYTYLNRIVAAAQSLDPNAYTNYETVQAIIDSIDYNLYEFEQDKVSDKANELIAAMDKLEEKTAADYTRVDEAVAKAKALDPTHYVDFSGVTNAVNAVVYGKFSDEQEAVDKMAQDILDAIDALELLCSIESSDSEIIPDILKMIIVISTEKISDLLNSLSTGGYIATHEPNAMGKFSTGSRIVLRKADETELVTNSEENTEYAAYTVVAVGDVNGDGFADGEDAAIVNLYINGNIVPEDKYLPAYDANCDGSITADDVELLEQVGLYNDVIINLYEPEAAE